MNHYAPEFDSHIADHNLAVKKTVGTAEQERSFHTLEANNNEEKLDLTIQEKQFNMTDVMQSYNYNTLYAYQQQAVSCHEDQAPCEIFDKNR